MTNQSPIVRGRYSLFSLRLFAPPLFEEKLKPRASVLRSAIEERPVYTTGRKRHWRLGNIAHVDDAIIFRVGRDKSRIAGILKGSDFDFDTQTEYPSTVVVIDPDRSTMAVRHSAELARFVGSIANVTGQLLRTTESLRESHYVLDVSAMSDPTGFAGAVREAESVKRFAVWLKRPNTFDADKDIIGPLERTVASVGGEKSRMSVTGQALDKNRVIDAAGSVASSGDDAEATIVDTDGVSRVVKLRGGEATFVAPGDDDDQSRRQLIQHMRNVRSRIRNA